MSNTLEGSTVVLVYTASEKDMLVVTGALPSLSSRGALPEGLQGLACPLYSSQLKLATGIVHALGDSPTLVQWPETSETNELLDLDFELTEGSGQPLPSSELDFRVPAGVEGSTESDVRAVLFPSFTTVMASWLRGPAAKSAGWERRVVVLVSGCVGPENFTKGTAELMSRFLLAAYGSDWDFSKPLVLHGNGDASRLEANERFCDEMLLPIMETLRNDVARRCGDKWAERLSVTLALCDGTPARTHFLSSRLREYRPEMAHLPPAKRFWHSCALRPGDVDRISFVQACEAANLAEVESLEDQEHRALVAEVVAHREFYLAGHNAFWQTKTGETVLSVLLVRRGGQLRMIRGINVELSTPAGFFCGERACISAAISTDPSVQPLDFRAIAVLAVDATRSGCRGPNPVQPCLVCVESFRPIYEHNPSFRVVMFEDESCTRIRVKTLRDIHL